MEFFEETSELVEYFVNRLKPNYRVFVSSSDFKYEFGLLNRDSLVEVVFFLGKVDGEDKYWIQLLREHGIVLSVHSAAVTRIQNVPCILAKESFYLLRTTPSETLGDESSFSFLAFQNCFHGHTNRYFVEGILHMIYDYCFGYATDSRTKPKRAYTKLVDIRDASGKWTPGIVLAKTPQNTLLVHYPEWGIRWNELLHERYETMNVALFGKFSCRVLPFDCTTCSICVGREVDVWLPPSNTCKEGWYRGTIERQDSLQVYVAIHSQKICRWYHL